MDISVRSFTFAAAACAAVAVALALGCTSKSSGTGLLASAPADAAKHQSIKIGLPYAQVAPGILGRTLYSTDSGQGYTIEIRELIVQPRRALSAFSLPGAAIIQNLSGIGTFSVEGSRAPSTSVSILSVPGGAKLMIANKSDRPVELRTFVFAAKGASQ
jgi:hypothetical protein